MKNLNAFIKLLPLIVLSAAVSGCVIEPIQNERTDITGAPDWVNKGSTSLAGKDGSRLFHGVSSATPKGDMALQKSIADDKSMAEVGSILSSYLDVAASDYMVSTQSRNNGMSEEVLSRHIEEAATSQVKVIVSRQIDEAIARQFKEAVTPQFKIDMTRQIQEAASRQIREAISDQTDFMYQMEDVISRQMKESVSHQIKNIGKANIAGTKIIGNWRDPQTNTIWSISELNLTYVKSTIPGAIDINADLKRYLETNADSIFDRILNENNNLFSIK